MGFISIFFKLLISVALYLMMFYVTGSTAESFMLGAVFFVLLMLKNGNKKIDEKKLEEEKAIKEKMEQNLEEMGKISKSFADIRKQHLDDKKEAEEMKEKEKKRAEKLNNMSPEHRMVNELLKKAEKDQLND